MKLTLLRTIAFILFAFVFLLNSYSIIIGIWSTFWTKDEAIIQSAEIITTSHSNGPKGTVQSNHVQVQYKYTVNNKNFIGNKIGYGVSSNHISTIKEFSKLSAGQKVTIYYSESFPKYSALKQGPHNYLDGLFAIFLVALFFYSTLKSKSIKKWLTPNVP